MDQNAPSPACRASVTRGPASTAVTTQGEINFPSRLRRQMGHLLLPSRGLHTALIEDILR